MTKKIFRSIILVALTVLLASIGMATSFLYEQFGKTQVRQLKAELSLMADVVNEFGTSYFDGMDSTVFRFTVVDADGTVLYDTEADAAEMENHADREEIKEAFRDGTGSSARTSATLMQKTLYEAVRLKNGDVLRISVSRLTVGALLLGMLTPIGAIVLIAAIVALLLSYKMANKITEPLLHLDLEHPVETETYEELTPILTKLRKQHGQIAAQMEELHRRSDELEQVVSSMREGLVLLDEHGMVLHMNAAAKRIFDVKDAREKDFLLIDRSDRMNHAMWNALEGKHGDYTEERNGIEYQFNINPILSDGKILGAVILAFDITDKAFAERNRREFSANVTHELKTPLQSIIGSAELLEQGMVRTEDTQRFAGHIRKEAVRLVDLINDIIRLSQLDEQTELPTENVALDLLVGEAVDVLTDAANQKNVTLHLDCEPCTVCGVRRYLYEIVYNLCDNAIRYNKDGGKVTVCVRKDAGHVTVTVADTGIGIPPEHLSRIFERFYRVDKSHSKETGGTGLGLSIVKHAVAYHGGKVTLDSEPGKGTTVTVVF